METKAGASASKRCQTKHQTPVNDCFASSGMTRRPDLMPPCLDSLQKTWVRGGEKGGASLQTEPVKKAVSGERSKTMILT